MKKKITNYVWGIFIILLGVTLLLKTLDVISFNIFFSGWWTLFIIIPSLIDLLFNDHKWSSFNLMLIGILLLLDCRDIIENSILVFLCVLIIELGIKMIFGKTFKNIKKSKNAQSYVGVFGESNSKNDDKDFKGCETVAVFGSVKLDLSDIEIKDDVRIDAVSVFGTVYLTVPENIDVEVNGVNIFGSSFNKNINNNSKHKIYIDSVCVFGDIRIK